MLFLRSLVFITSFIAPTIAPLTSKIDELESSKSRSFSDDFQLIAELMINLSDKVPKTVSVGCYLIFIFSILPWAVPKSVFIQQDFIKLFKPLKFWETNYDQPSELTLLKEEIEKAKSTNKGLNKIIKILTVQLNQHTSHIDLLQAVTKANSERATNKIKVLNQKIDCLELEKKDVLRVNTEHMNADEISEQQSASYLVVIKEEEKKAKIQLQLLDKQNERIKELEKLAMNYNNLKKELDESNFLRYSLMIQHTSETAKLFRNHKDELLKIQLKGAKEV